MFIQTEATPNPATLKFLPGQDVLGQGAMEFRSRDDAAHAPLAEALLSIDGVEAVMYGADFVSVTKNGAEWPHLKPAILGTIMEHFASGAPLLTEGAAPAQPDGEFYRLRRRRDGRHDQGVDRDARAPGGRRRRRRHRLPRLQRRRRLSRHEGRLLRMPVVHRDVAARHREPAQAFPAAGEGGRAGVGAAYPEATLIALRKPS